MADLVLNSEGTSRLASRCDCKHCGEAIPAVRQKKGSEGVGSDFCCDGCSSVYQLLHELNLADDFYNRRLTSTKFAKVDFAHVNGGRTQDFSILDRPPFRSNDSKEAASLDFFLEGIHCSACVWILEKLPEIHSDIDWARLDLGRSTLSVGVKADGKFENVAQILMKLGYVPQPVLSEAESVQKLKSQDIVTLKRMGVAAFAAMNVMIYSVSLYDGVDGSLAILFRVLSLLAALPALSYSAWPFYRSAYYALKNRRISIDLPISLAFLGGFFESLRQVYLQTNLLYLDSLTSLVFLMLASRYMLSRLERAEISKSGLFSLLIPEKVLRIKSNKGGELLRQYVALGELEEGDWIEVVEGGRIPADGEVVFGFGSIDLSFLTGESKPLKVNVGDSAFAGSMLVSGRINVVVRSVGRNTRLGTIESRIKNSVKEDSQVSERSDRWAQYFLGLVMLSAFSLLFFMGLDHFSEALRRSLSLLIVACPCALALATPLTLAKAYKFAASRGVVIRDVDVFNRISSIKRILFDKTGTLTLGRPEVTDWTWFSNVDPNEKRKFLSVAYALEEHSTHPYGYSILRYLEKDDSLYAIALKNHREDLGVGVFGTFESDEYALKKGDGVWADYPLVMMRNGVAIASISFRDLLREHAKEVVCALKNSGYSVEILSGDHPEVVKEVATQLGIEHFKGGVTPEEKLQFVRSGPLSRQTMMIGDGLNDALALNEAFVGFVFHRGGSLESALTHADVSTTRSDLRLITHFLYSGEKFKQVLFRNAVFSALYNITGALLALGGWIHPLLAAIAMPLSSMTVFLSTAIGFREVSLDETSRIKRGFWK